MEFQGHADEKKGSRRHHSHGDTFANHRQTLNIPFQSWNLVTKTTLFLLQDPTGCIVDSLVNRPSPRDLASFAIRSTAILEDRTHPQVVF